jgi:signal transduction histidine kinase
MGLIQNGIRHIHYVISRKLLINSKKEDQIRFINRFMILLLYMATGLIVIGAFTVQDLLTDDYKHLYLIDIPAFILFSGMSISLLIRRNVNTISHIFTLFFVYIIITVFITGGGHLTGAAFYIIFPPVVLFIYGFRTGILYSIALLAILVIILFLFHTRSWFPAYDTHTFYRYLIIALIIVSAILLYENIIQTYQLSNIKLINRIKGQNERLKKSTNKLQFANEKLLNSNHELEKRTKETEQLNNSLSKANATKDKFFSIISHDLKNPINTLDGFVKLLNERYDSYSDDKKLKYIQIISESSSSLSKLIEGLLEWSRMQTDGFKFSPQEIHLLPLIDMVFDNFMSQAINKDISLINQVDFKTKVFADYQMLYSVLRNFISNAIKFTRTNGYVRIYSETEENFVKICCEDNGVGIKEEYLEKLFQIDTSLSTPGTNNETGTGLGLILCKEFIEKNNGKIGVISQEGKGSTFWFLIPKVG